MPQHREKKAVCGAHCREEMRKVGFDEVKIDGLGNVIGRVGNGPRRIAMDAHIDTVDVGNPELWEIDPFAAILKDDIIYGRGALCDTERCHGFPGVWSETY